MKLSAVFFVAVAQAQDDSNYGSDYAVDSDYNANYNNNYAAPADYAPVQTDERRGAQAPVGKSEYPLKTKIELSLIQTTIPEPQEQLEQEPPPVDHHTAEPRPGVPPPNPTTDHQDLPAGIATP